LPSFTFVNGSGIASGGFEVPVSLVALILFVFVAGGASVLIVSFRKDEKISDLITRLHTKKGEIIDAEIVEH